MNLEHMHEKCPCIEDNW